MKKKIGALLVAGVAAVSLVATLGLAGCGSQDAGMKAENVQVFAANSLEKALPEVQKLYTDANPGVSFADTQFKASGDLVQQIAAGADADAFIAASTGSMDDAASYIDEATRADMFVNDLVVVVKKDSGTKIESLADLAKVEGKIAIGDAATVPAGKYANQALASVDLYTNAEGVDGEYADSIKDKVVLGDKVGTVANYVATGDAEVGLVYTSDIYRYDGIEVALTTPSDSHKPIKYPGAVLKSSKNAEVAADFLKFCVENPDAQNVFSQYGFELASK